MLRKISVLILLFCLALPAMAMAQVYTTTGTKQTPIFNPNIQTEDWGAKYININRWWSQGYNGKGIKIAVIDTGIDYTHADLRDNIGGGVSVVSYTRDFMDDEGHGTHVAGIIGAQDNGIGSKGIANGAKIYAVKALNQDGQGTVDDLTKGIRWCIANDIDIINMSVALSNDELWTPQFKRLEAAINEAYYEHGIYIVAATGNEGVAHVSYPAAFPAVIGVGAVYEHVGSLTGKEYPMWADFSNYGRYVEVVAPGTFVYSTYPLGMETFWNAPAVGYEFNTGTSMAAPYVTGFLAILKQKHPADSLYRLRQRLHENTVKIGKPGEAGYGMIKAITQ